MTFQREPQGGLGSDRADRENREAECALSPGPQTTKNLFMCINIYMYTLVPLFVKIPLGWDTLIYKDTSIYKDTINTSTHKDTLIYRGTPYM